MLFKSKFGSFFLFPDLSVTERSVLISPSIIDLWQLLFLQLSNFTLYLWCNVIIYIWIWNHYIYHLNHFLLFGRNFSIPVSLCAPLSFVPYLLLFFYFHLLCVIVYFSCVACKKHKNPIYNIQFVLSLTNLLPLYYSDY